MCQMLNRGYKIVKNLRNKEYVPETFWDERARCFGDLGDAYLDRDYQDYELGIRMKKAFEMLPIKPGMHILDAGCGTARWSIQLARMGAIVTGIDMSREMLELAKQRATENQVQNITFLNQSIEELSFRRTFDATICITVLQHITDGLRLNLAVDKIIQLTKKGGLILTMDSAPAKKKEDMVILDMGVKHMEVRTKGEWIDLFESKGAEFLRSREISLVGRHLLRLLRLKNKYIREGCRKVVELVDVNLSETRYLRRYSQPTALLFRVRD